MAIDACCVAVAVENRRFGPIVFVCARWERVADLLKLTEHIQQCGLGVGAAMADRAILLVQSPEQASRSGGIVRHVAGLTCILRDSSVSAHVDSIRRGV